MTAADEDRLLDSGAIKAITLQIDKMREEIVSLASQLVKIQSVNPRYPDSDAEKYLGGEKECNAFLEGYLSSIGCKTDLFEKSKDRTNLVGRKSGERGGRSLIFSGHVDTVPFGRLDTWSHGGPLSGEIDDGKIFGRGACDMKAGIASMCKALEAISRAGYLLAGDLILESVVGEETMDHLLGSTASIDRGYRADAAIIAEPNSLRLSPVTTGVILMTVEVEGKSTHATARDEMIRAGGSGDAAGVNAIEKAIKVMEILRLLEEQWGITKRHPLFKKPGHFVIHPGVIDGAPHGHRYVAVVPDYCVIDYAVLYEPSESPEQVKKEISDFIDMGCGLDTWLSRHPPKIRWNGVWPSGEISKEHPICKSLSYSFESCLGMGVEVEGFPAPMDAPFFDAAGIPTAVFGPGNLPQAHSGNEYVEIDQVIRATKVLALTAMNWCGYSRA